MRARARPTFFIVRRPLSTGIKIFKANALIVVRRVSGNLLWFRVTRWYHIMLGSHPRWGWKSYFSLTLLNSIRFLSGLLGQGADFFIEALLKRLILEAG